MPAKESIRDTPLGEWTTNDRGGRMYTVTAIRPKLAAARRT
jgi:hypothetical protein